MKLHQLKQTKGSKIKSFRKGRGIGSGLGKTCGKGHKGQRARSGHMKLGFEGGQMPLYRRIPKMGFYYVKKHKNIIVNVNVLEKYFDNGDIVNIDNLKKKNIVKIKENDNNYFIKILGKGKITKKISLEVNNKKMAISKMAKEKILKAGGNIIIK